MFHSIIQAGIKSLKNFTSGNTGTTHEISSPERKVQSHAVPGHGMIVGANHVIRRKEKEGIRGRA